MATLATSCGKDTTKPVGLDLNGRRLPPPLDVFPMRPIEESTETETVEGKETTTWYRAVCEIRLPDVACTTTDLSGAEPDIVSKSRVTKSGVESLGSLSQTSPSRRLESGVETSRSRSVVDP